ncbi:MAG: hypothetical protein ACYYKD_02110 [Rhodospirillales bacterium]
MNRNIEDLFMAPGAAAARRARRLIPVSESGLALRLEAESPESGAWVRAHGFKARAGTVLMLPGSAARPAPCSAACPKGRGCGIGRRCSKLCRPAVM